MNNRIVERIESILKEKLDVSSKLLDKLTKDKEYLSKIESIIALSIENVSSVLTTDRKIIEEIISMIYKDNYGKQLIKYKQAIFVEEHLTILKQTSQYQDSRLFLQSLLEEIKKYYFGRKQQYDEEEQKYHVTTLHTKETLSHFINGNLVTPIDNIDYFLDIVNNANISIDEKAEISKFILKQNLRFYLLAKELLIDKSQVDFNFITPKEIKIISSSVPERPSFELNEQQQSIYEEICLINNIKLNEEEKMINNLHSICSAINESDITPNSIINSARCLFGYSNNYLKEVMILCIQQSCKTINDFLAKIASDSEAEKLEDIELLSIAFEDVKEYLEEYNNLVKTEEKEEVIIEESDKSFQLVFMPTSLNGDNTCFENDLKDFEKLSQMYPNIIEMLDDLKKGNGKLGNETKGKNIGTFDEKIKGFYEVKYKKSGDLPAARIIYLYYPNNTILLYGIFLKKDAPIRRIKGRKASNSIQQVLIKYKQILKEGGLEAEKIIKQSEVAEKRIYEFLRNTSKSISEEGKAEETHIQSLIGGRNER